MEKKARIRWQTKASAAENVKQVLPQLAHQFFSMGRAAAHSNATFADLHALRLAGKRFRYTLELFAPCYGAGLARRLKMMKRIQDYLGDLNDCVTAEEVLAGAPADKSFENFLEQRKARLKEEFVRHWVEDFDKPGAEQAWVAYLTRHIRSAKESSGPRSNAGGATGANLTGK